MNIIEAQVSQVKRDGETYTIPPINVCKRYTQLAATVIYDILQSNPNHLSFSHIDKLCQDMCLPERYRSRGAIEDFVTQKGRIVIDSWMGPVTHTSHVEPV